MNDRVCGYVQSLYFYPIKSCGSIVSESLDLHADIGVYGDRWVALVHPETHIVLTQREFPKLATIRIDPQMVDSKGTLMLSVVLDGILTRVEMPFRRFNNDKREFKLHKDVAFGYVLGSSSIFERMLGYKPLVVILDEKSPRIHKSSALARDVPLGFADGYPVLVTATASLSALNKELAEKGKSILPMNRFRPNIVVSSTYPWEEDSWKLIKIGSAVLEYAKPCSRCVMTTINQVTGEKDIDAEPLRTLSRIRPARGGPLFGAYYVVRKRGRIFQEMPIELISKESVH